MHRFLKFALLQLSIAGTVCMYAQADYKFVKSIPSEARIISTDQLGFVYLVERNNVVKYTREGKLINQYSNNRYGDIRSIDATDPYKIIVFYDDFRIVVILDNQLSENGSHLDLQFTIFDQPVLACRAYNTGIWLFDLLLNDLNRLTLSLKVVQTTGNLSQILGYKILPNFMIEYNNNLYLNNPETGILVFDQFGTYVKNIAIKGLESFQVTEKCIYFSKDNKILKYDFKDLDISALPLPEEKIQKMAVHKNRMFITTGKEVKLYDYMEK